MPAMPWGPQKGPLTSRDCSPALPGDTERGGKEGGSPRWPGWADVVRTPGLLQGYEEPRVGWKPGGPSWQPRPAAWEATERETGQGVATPPGSGYHLWVPSLGYPATLWGIWYPRSLGWPFLSLVSLTSLPLLRAPGTSRGPLGNDLASGMRAHPLELAPPHVDLLLLCLLPAHTPARVQASPTSTHPSPCLSALLGRQCSPPQSPCPSGPTPIFGFGHPGDADSPIQSGPEGQWAKSCALLPPPRPPGASSSCPTCQPASLSPPGPGVGGQPLPHPQSGPPNPSQVKVTALGQLTPS